MHPTDPATGRPDLLPCQIQWSSPEARHEARRARGGIGRPRQGFTRRHDDFEGRKTTFPTRSLKDRIREGGSAGGRITGSMVDGKRDYVRRRNFERRRNTFANRIVGIGRPDGGGHVFAIGVIDDRIAFVNQPQFLAFVQLHLPGIVLRIQRTVDFRERHSLVWRERIGGRSAAQSSAGQHENCDERVDPPFPHAEKTTATRNWSCLAETTPDQPEVSRFPQSRRSRRRNGSSRSVAAKPPVLGTPLA